MSDFVAGNEMDASTGKQNSASRWLRFLPIAVILAGLVFGYLMGWHRFLSLDYLAQSRDSLMGLRIDYPLIAPLVFFVLYVLAVAFSFPAASVLTIFGGFLFGWLLGGVLVAFAATIGATLLFLAARTAFGDLFREKLGGKLAKVSKGLDENAFGFLLVLRLAPIFPFFVVNIAPAFCGVPVRTFIAATFLGILPGVFAYAYLGDGIDSVIAAAQAAGSTISISDLVTPKITAAFLGLALVAAIPIIVRRLRKAPRH